MYLVSRVVAVMRVPHLTKDELNGVEPFVQNQVGNVCQYFFVLVFAVVVRDYDQAPCRVLRVIDIHLDGRHGSMQLRQDSVGSLLPLVFWHVDVVSLPGAMVG